MIEIRLYCALDFDIWNTIASQADNNHFMINRSYMDYHQDRFQDNSFIIFKDNRAIGIIPGNRFHDDWYSHQGLSFGGMYMLPEYNRINIYISTIELLSDSLKKLGFKKATFRMIPHIYHIRPCESELYIFQRYQIESYYQEVSTAINLSSNIRQSQLRKRGQKKALSNGISIKESNDFSFFWDIMNQRLLEKYQKKSVHSLDEIHLLKSKFPHNIKLFQANHADQGVCAGVVIYETSTVAHAQYITSNNFGMENGALDLLFNVLIAQYRDKNFKYFNFGISTEDRGSILNDSLIQFKESFGGRSIVHHSIVINL